MKIYIAGKIAGDRRYRAKFREAAKALEAAGHVVLNPATLPDGLTDGDYMRIALAMLEASDLAVFLPDYQESRGANDQETVFPGGKVRRCAYCVAGADTRAGGQPGGAGGAEKAMEERGRNHRLVPPLPFHL